MSEGNDDAAALDLFPLDEEQRELPDVSTDALVDQEFYDELEVDREMRQELEVDFDVDTTPAKVALVAPVPAGLAEADSVIYAFQRNLVVAASAGTGKTHRLTALYVLLALGLTSRGQPYSTLPARAMPPDRMIATTFSRAAAREIGHRIERSLQQLAHWDGSRSILFGDIIHARLEMLGSTLTIAGLRKRAEDALLHWPAARIDTLHGVAKQIVDRHAIALGLPPGARILDEEEAQALCDLAVDETLSGALAEGGVQAEAARTLLSACGNMDAVRSQVTRLLDRLDEEGLSPLELATTDHTLEARGLCIELQRLAQQLVVSGHASFRDAAMAFIRAMGQGAAGELLPGTAIGPALQLLTQRKPSKTKCSPADDELAAFREDLSGTTHKEKAQRLLTFLREAAQLEPREKQLLGLLEQIRERVEAIRRTEGALGFGDLLRAARDGLRDDAAIGHAVREGVDVLLVDEFQDTSSVQRDLVYLLHEREDAAVQRQGKTVPGPASLKPHGLFIVGDRKQSIYGFRGADVSVFCRVCAELAGDAAAEALQLDDRPGGESPVADFVALRESRRSGAPILSFVNAFSAIDFAPRPALSHSWGPHPPSPPLPNERGGNEEAEPRSSASAIGLRGNEGLWQRGTGGEGRGDFEITYSAAEHLVPAPSMSATEPTEVVLVADDGTHPEGADALVREATGSLREALVAAAYVAHRVRSEQTPVRFLRDIAILARRRRTIPLIELALSRLDIPYVVAGRALFDAAEVRDVAAILRLLLDPRDRLALATVLRGPMVALSDTTLAMLSLPGRGLTVPLSGRWPTSAKAAMEALPPLSKLPTEDRARLEVFRARYSALRRAALRSSPGEAIRAAIAAFDLDRVLAALPRAQARIGNVDRLVTLARRRGGTLASFIRWLDRRIHDEADEPEAAVFSAEDDAVRVTTIHAAKGLDFPATILVDLNAQPAGDLAGLGFIPPTLDRPPAFVVRHFAPRLSSRASIVRHPQLDSLAPEIPLATPAVQRARAEVRARERAERARLTYVAMTRARHELVLIAPADKPRFGSAWYALKTGLDTGRLLPHVGTTIEARGLLSAAKPLPPGTTAYARPAPDIASPAPVDTVTLPRTVAIATGPLSLFDDCPRRFRLRELLGFDEPTTTGQLGLFDLDGPDFIPGEERVEPSEGMLPPVGRAANRVLERWPRARWGAATRIDDMVHQLIREGLSPKSPQLRRLSQGMTQFVEGAYSRRVRELGATLLREEAFVLTVGSEDGHGSQHLPLWTGPSLSLRGAMDLVVVYPSDDIDVVEYRQAKPRTDLSPYEFSLRAYGLLMQKRYPHRAIRVGVLFLGWAKEPVWLKTEGSQGALSRAEHTRFEEKLRELAERLAEARAKNSYPAVSVETCRKLKCGFIKACHGESAGDRR